MIKNMKAGILFGCFFLAGFPMKAQMKEFFSPVPDDPTSKLQNWTNSKSFQTQNYLCWLKNAGGPVWWDTVNVYNGSGWKKLVKDSLQSPIQYLDEQNDTFVIVQARWNNNGATVYMYDGTQWKKIAKLSGLIGKHKNYTYSGLSDIKFYHHKLYSIFTNTDLTSTLLEYDIKRDSVRYITSFQQKSTNNVYNIDDKMKLYVHKDRLYLAGPYDSVDHVAAQGYGYFDGSSFKAVNIFPTTTLNYCIIKPLDNQVFAVQRLSTVSSNIITGSSLFLIRNDTVIRNITGNLYKKYISNFSLSQMNQHSLNVFWKNGKICLFSHYNTVYEYDESYNRWFPEGSSIIDGYAFLYKNNKYIFSSILKLPYIAGGMGCFVMKPSPYLSGYAYLDVDDNCTRNVNDPLLKSQWITLNNNSTNVATLSDSKGWYEIPVRAGTYKYVTSAKSLLNGLCKDSIVVDSLSQYIRDVSFNFVPPYNTTGDIVLTASGTILRRGQDYRLSLLLENIGKPVLTVSPSLSFNSKLKFKSSTAGIASQTGHSIQFKPVQVGASSAVRIEIVFFAHQDTFAVGDTVIFEASTDTLNTEVSYNNNREILKERVRGPVDPNMITGNPEGELIHSPRNILYTVEFQNLGTDTAFNVRIVDTLPSLLNASSIKILSHSGKEIAAYLSGQVVQFRLDGIKLTTKSTSIEKSKGYVIFSVDLKDSLPFWKTIRNKTGIYFDYEKAVNTNTSELKRVKPDVMTNLSVKVCGAPYYFNGDSIRVSGTYFDTLKAYEERDSIIVLHINFVNPSYRIMRKEVCKGSSVLFNNLTINSPGTYTDTLINSVGCDSITILTVVHLQHSSSKISAAVCKGQPYTFNNLMITSAGIYMDTLINSVGCDSIVTLTLIHLQHSSSKTNASVCKGQPYTFNNLTITAPGIYTDTLINGVGCDSIVTMTLTHLQHSLSKTNATICKGEYFTFNNRNYTLKGIYTVTLSNYLGCDSICTLELNVDSVDAGIQKNGRKLSSTVSNANYQWFDCDSGYKLITGQTQQSFSAGHIGSYAVVVTEGTCSDTSRCVSVDANDLSINSGNSISDLIIIYPNPGNGEFTIKVRLPGTLLIYDQCGKLLLDKMLPDHEKINLENAAPGIYYFIYQTALGQKTGKIVIQSSF